MNKAVKLAKGEYFLFLNSGDYLLHDNVLMRVSKFLHTYDVISGDIVLEENQKTYERPSPETITLDFFFKISLYHQATFISKKMFELFEPYNESFKIGGDYEFFIRLFFKFNATYLHVNEPISYFKADGISNNIAFTEIKVKESALAWQHNIPERVWEALTEHQEFKKSPVYWLYLKVQKPGIYRSVFTFINQLRNKLYRLLKTG